jgi:exodeoxyribonuclease-3
MKLISYNVNGIRSALSKGLIDWIKEENPDVFCVQETKATEDQISRGEFEKLGYRIFWHAAEKKGYSGVAVFSKITPDFVAEGMGMPEYDREGRVLRLDFGDITLLNCYFPSGTSGDERQDFKYKFLDDFNRFIESLKKIRPRIIICGDLNIAHCEIDIHNPVSNKNSSGFLPDERAWFTRFLLSGFTDAFRSLHTVPHRYSWWTYRMGARSRNLGWRIDYFLVSEPLSNKIKESQILDGVVHSDHCPVTLTLR